MKNPLPLPRPHIKGPDMPRSTRLRPFAGGGSQNQQILPNHTRRVIADGKEKDVRVKTIPMTDMPGFAERFNRFTGFGIERI